MQGKYAARRVDGLEGLQRLRGEWVSLHGDADLFCRYEWHLGHARHLIDRSAPPAFVQLLDGPKTVGIVPMIAMPLAIAPFGALRVLSLGLGPLMPLEDFPLAREASVPDAAAALAQALATWTEAWDAIVWPRVLASGNAVRVARALGPSIAHLEPAAPCDVLDTSRPFEQVSSGWSKNLRASVHKSIKRLAERGRLAATRNGVAFWPADATGPLATGPEAARTLAAFEAFLAIEASGWKGEKGEGTAVALVPAVRAFFAELIEHRGADFTPEIVLLLLDDRPIAGQFTLRTNRCRYSIKIGYDEGEARFSPGQCLMAMVVEDACREGLAGVDLITSAQWHAPWRPQRLATCEVTIFRRHWRTAAHRAYRLARRTARTILGPRRPAAAPRS